MVAKHLIYLPDRTRRHVPQ